MAKSLYPYPVICGFFNGGEQIRMSFFQPAGKAWRFPAMVTMIKRIIGDERARTANPEWARQCGIGNNYQIPHGAPAEDLLCYYIEWQGDVIRDEPSPTPAMRRKARQEARQRSRDPHRKRVAVYQPAKPKARQRRSKRRVA